MDFSLGPVDLALLVFLAASSLLGLMRGGVYEMLALAGWFVAVLAARAYGTSWQAYLHIGAPSSALNHVAACTAVFLLTLVAWGLAARLVRALIRATPLSPIDRVLGAGFGVLRGVVVLLVVALVVQVSPWHASPAWQGSHAAVWLNALLHELQPVFSREVTQHLSA